MIEVPHNRIDATPAEAEAVATVVRSGYWTGGPQVEALEARLAEMSGRKHAVCVASGLSALRLALVALGVTTGDRVAVPGYSCVALPNSCLSLGAEPVETDIRAHSWNLDTSLIERRSVTVAIGVNTFGVPLDLADLDGGESSIVEDCAHAFGVSFDGKPLGSRAKIGVLSFHATKLIGAGEGGAALTDSDEIADTVRGFRDYADQAPDGNKLNDKMSDLEAALALERLRSLQDALALRKSIASRYMEELNALAKDTGRFDLPTDDNLTWYRFVLRLNAGNSVEEAIEGLAARGIGCAAPVADWRRHPTRSPVSSQAYETLLSIPIYPGLSSQEQDRVIEALHGYFSSKGG